ncbi:MAG: hypothetical protein M3Y87_30125 [Myxococcota bacterium]|nr:hypothetical protein [Myxococcota bacterium]
MARSIVIRFEGEESAFGFAKVEREKLYGKKQRIVVDEAGRDCATAWLTADGTALVPNGGTAHVWVDERWDAAEQDTRIAVDEAGRALETRPSTLGVAQDGRVVDARRVLDHVVSALYELTPETLGAGLEAELAAGRIVELPFRYRDGLEEDVLFVLKNDEGVFALIGRDAELAFLERDVLPVGIEPGGDEGDELSDDLDFSMM